MDPVVVIRPLSGYINRLQAIISARLLAEDLGARLWVDWAPSEVAPVMMDAVLDPVFCAEYAHSSDEIRNAFGVDPARVEPYLCEDPARGVLTLAGLDRGEQAFMPDLKRLWSQGGYSAVIISAGGKFTLDGGQRLTGAERQEFREHRREAYRRLLLSPHVEEAADMAQASHAPFIALHLRYSDRSLESPWSRQIGPALLELQHSTSCDNLFIAADTPGIRDKWLRKAEAMGMRAWVADLPSFPRADPRSATAALVDWRILTRSGGLVYFSASSFAEEAAVASGHFDTSIGLAGGPVRRAYMRMREYAHAAATYRDRH